MRPSRCHLQAATQPDVRMLVHRRWRRCRQLQGPDHLVSPALHSLITISMPLSWSGLAALHDCNTACALAAGSALLLLCEEWMPDSWQTRDSRTCVCSYDYSAPLSEAGHRGQPGIGGPDKFQVSSAAIWCWLPALCCNLDQQPCRLPPLHPTAGHAAAACQPPASHLMAWVPLEVASAPPTACLHVEPLEAGLVSLLQVLSSPLCCCR